MIPRVGEAGLLGIEAMVDLVQLACEPAVVCCATMATVSFVAASGPQRARPDLWGLEVPRLDGEWRRS